MELRLDSEVEGGPGPILELPFGPEFLCPLSALPGTGRQVYRRPVTGSSQDLTWCLVVLVYKQKQSGVAGSTLKGEGGGQP